jgi:hypothetical protein
MSLSFPPGAINGQVYQGWVFDGVKWNPNWAANFVTSVNNKSGALMPADVVGPANRVLLMNKTVVPASPAATIDMFYNFTNQYDQYELDIYDYQSVGATGNCYLEVSFDGSTFLQDASYHYVSIYAQAGVAGVNSAGSVSATGIYLGSAVASAGGVSETRVKFSMPWTTDRYKYFMVDHVVTLSAIMRFSGAGAYLGSAGIQPLKGLRVKFDSPNVARGVVNLYGLVKPPIGGT